MGTAQGDRAADTAAQAPVVQSSPEFVPATQQSS
jgi:hypothetical protein